MRFYPTNDWAEKAIKETVAIPFPSLEPPEFEKGTEGTAKVTDPKPPELEHQQSSPSQVNVHGNGRWNRDSGMRFNAGCNPHHSQAPEKGNVGIAIPAYSRPPHAAVAAAVFTEALAIMSGTN